MRAIIAASICTALAGAVGVGTTEAGVFVPVSMESKVTASQPVDYFGGPSTKQLDLATPTTDTLDTLLPSGSVPLAGLDLSLDATSAPRLTRVVPDVSTDVPVEPIPTPTAAAAGLVVLCGWAGIRMIRRVSMA